MTKLLTIFAAGVFLFAIGCSSNNSADKSAPQNATAQSHSGDSYTASTNGTTVAGVTFYPDQSWTDLGPSGMRQADYMLRGVDGESDSATVNVFYFGPSSGGGVQDNLNRWIGQMDLGGKEPTRSTFEVAGMTAYVVEAMGTYNGMMGGPMSGNATSKENYRMTGVVLEGPEGNVFFKLTGPDKTALKMTDQFMGMIRGITKATM